MAIDWSEYKPNAGRVVVRFKRYKADKDEATGMDIVKIKGSAIALPASFAAHGQDAWRDEDERSNRGVIVAMGGAQIIDGRPFLPPFAEGDRVIAKRGFGTLLEEGEDYEDRLLLWSEIGAFKKEAKA